MAVALIDTTFLEVVYGETITDTSRAEVLIEIASGVVLEYCNATWTASTAPMSVQLVVAQMTCDALAAVPADTATVKAEQIGDYRVEFARTSTLAIDVDRYRSTLNRYRLVGYSVVTPVPVDNPTAEDDDESGEGDV